MFEDLQLWLLGLHSKPQMYNQSIHLANYVDMIKKPTFFKYLI